MRSLIWLGFLSATLSAQTPSNPDFNADLSGWSIAAALGGTVNWTALDFAASPSSGSAQLLNDAPFVPVGPGSYRIPLVAVEQCLSVFPSTMYSLGFNGLIPAGQSVTGSTAFYFYFYPSSDCSGAYSLTNAIGVAAIGVWARVDTGFASPAGAQSVRISVGSYRDEQWVTGSYLSYVDHVTFAPQLPVGLIHFDAE